jgi:glycosyl transferase, family 25
MQAYVINMDSAKERWNYVAAEFAKTGIPFERVSGVNGRKLQLPIPEFDEVLYRRRHGKHPNGSTIGCYLSHLKVLRHFLESSHAYAIICEDDIRPVVNLKSLLERALEHTEHWDILRLSGFHNSHPNSFASLGDGYSLAINLTRLCGSGAYMVHRQAAEVLLRQLVPMSLPLDHALDREWAYGLKSASIFPLPVDQVDHAFGSQIRETVGEKLPIWRRYWTVFPFRALNEVNRVVSRRRRLKEAKAA